MARAFGYCLKREPVPKWYRLHNAIEGYGVKAVFGRDVLSPDEIVSMNITANIIKAFQSREESSDWAKWNERNPKLAEMLNLASAEWEKEKTRRND